MKVLHILNELKPSGAETMLRSAAPYWAQHDVECEILASGAELGEFANALRGVGYPIHHLPSRRSPNYFLQFRRFVRRGGYALVHQHAEKMSYWFGLAAMSAGAGLVRTLHSNFAFKGNLRWRRTLQRRHLKALGARFVSIAVGVQRNERNRYGLETDVVWNWVDTGRFRPVQPHERAAARQRWSFADDHVVLVSVGNCSEVKNHAAILEALAELRDLPYIRYLHVGQEDVDCRERQLAKQLGVSKQVVFCGWMSEARDAMAAADLYVMPSKYEGLGIAAVEALGVGLPALLGDSPGLRDLDQFFPGLRYAAPEPAAIASALRELAALDSGSRARIAAAFPHLVREKFDVARGVSEYCAIYHSAARPSGLG